MNHAKRYTITGAVRPICVETPNYPGPGRPVRPAARHKSRWGFHDRTPVADCQIRLHGIWLIILLACSMSALADPAPIIGRWQLDTAASGNAAKELKGIQQSKRKRSSKAEQRHSSGQGGSTQQRYWEEANAGNEWRHTDALGYAGPMQRLLESENLEIVPNDKGYLFIYADGYERSVAPNPGGRVFTASGEELVKTEIGYTLAYWDAATLVLETRIKGGGKLTERVSTSKDGSRLSMSIEIDRRDWKWIAKVGRFFDRSQ
jgi:hypothetical protein